MTGNLGQDQQVNEDFSEVVSSSDINKVILAWWDEAADENLPIEAKNRLISCAPANTKNDRITELIARSIQKDGEEKA
jgi:hypothetical protein